jgi:hypothetical protein
MIIFENYDIYSAHYEWAGANGDMVEILRHHRETGR